MAARVGRGRETPEVEYLVCINLCLIPQETLVIISISRRVRGKKGGRLWRATDMSAWVMRKISHGHYTRHAAAETPAPRWLQ